MGRGLRVWLDNSICPEEVNFLYLPMYEQLMEQVRTEALEKEALLPTARRPSEEEEPQRKKRSKEESEERKEESKEN